MPYVTDEVQTLARAGKLPDAVCAYVKQKDYVSFVQIERLLTPYLPIKGNHALCFSDHENIVLWAGMSQEWVTLMRQLLAEHRVYPYPSVPMVYWVDGGVPVLPLARTVRHYKDVHWFPVTLRVIPPAVKGKKGVRP